MAMLCAVFGLFLGAGILSLGLGRRMAACHTVRILGLIGSALGLGLALWVLWENQVITFELPLGPPIGRALIRLDSVSAAFLLPMFPVFGAAFCTLPAGIGTVEGRPHYGRHGFFFCLTALATLLVVTAADGIFFLTAWEIMSLAPFFLLGPRDRDANERSSAWVYIAAAHLGALPLLLLFAALSAGAGGTTFAAYAANAANLGGPLAGALFLAALVGFGAKLGLAPLHIWMPEAYPTAPSHVAALLSGAVINAGVYALWRILPLLGEPHMWWAYTLMGVGAFSAVFGVLFALIQTDLRRGLAYSGAENMGIICLLLGAGLLAGMRNTTLPALFFIAGAFLHLWNHSLFKSLAFLGAGAVQVGTGTTRISSLGGLQKRMPFTAACMAGACAALAGVPPLNGFIGEFLAVCGFVQGARFEGGGEGALMYWVGLITLGGTAGLALMAFSRFYGLIFLGAPRSGAALNGLPPGRAVRLAMPVLLALCVASTLAAPLIFLLASAVCSDFFRSLGLVPPDLSDMFRVASALGNAALFCAGLAATGAALWLLRRFLVAKRGQEEGITWDCGYRLPSSRMQYTGGSFSATAAQVMRGLTRPAIDMPFEENPRERLRPLFPRRAEARFQTPDWGLSLWENLLFKPIARMADAAKVMQHGLVNGYILYILIALVLALTWALGWS